jgi:hypothetical protein
MLLDTCVIQNLEWVWDRMEEERGEQWTGEQVQELERQFGPQLAEELLALGCLVSHLQWEGFPWLVSASARGEIERFRGRKQAGILRGWTRLSEAQGDWANDSFRGVAASVLEASAEVRVNPLTLRGLGVRSVDEIVANDGPLSIFRDRGDRALIRDALLSGVPAILTTDLRSFWNHREALYDYGVEVWRPHDALNAYEPVWAAEAAMLARRLVEHDTRRRDPQ